MQEKGSREGVVVMEALEARTRIRPRRYDTAGHGDTINLKKPGYGYSKDTA